MQWASAAPSSVLATPNEFLIVCYQGAGGYVSPVCGVMRTSGEGVGAAPITPLAFIKKWKKVSLTERQAAQAHFLDLCALLGHPTPIEDDPTGESFAFEKGAAKVGGGRGFADVWKKDHFAWEYKRKNGNLDDALLQLIRYASALESPPLHVVCDVERFRIHTAWTNTIPASYEITLDTSRHRAKSCATSFTIPRS